MKRTVCVKIRPTPEQEIGLKNLMHHWADVCNFVAQIAQEHKTSDRRRLHHLAYRRTRETCGSHAQITCLALVQASSAYRALLSRGQIKPDHTWPTLRFHNMGSVPFDQRTYRAITGGFSLYTPKGRIKVASVAGTHQDIQLQNGKLQTARLVKKPKGWFLHIALNRNAPERKRGTKTLGVDVGEVVIAATSTGKIFHGRKLRHDRDVYTDRRRALQRKGSQSAKMALRKASGREARHVRHVNHVISSQIVQEAITSQASCIALEDLTNIRQRMRSGRRVRSRLHRWPWRQLQDFISYKAQDAGIATVYIDPAYTSQTCCRCLVLGKRERSKFSCSCGNLRHADVNSAFNISRLASPIGDVTPRVTAGQVALGA